MTEIVLPEMDLDIIEQLAMCNQCEAVLRRCFSFKSSYSCIEDFILKFVNREGTALETFDLKELYMRKHNLSDNSLLNNRSVCRFCMELVTDGSFISLAEEDDHVLQNCVTLVDLKLTSDPVICGSCHKSLNCYSNFIDKCMETEGNIKKLRELNIKEEIVMEENVASLSNCDESKKDLINCEQEVVKRVLQDSEEKVKMELCTDELIIEGDIVYPKLEEAEEYREDIQEDTVQEAKPEMKLRPTKQEELQRYHCESSTFTTKRETNLKRRALKHRNSSPVRLQCPECGYETTNKRTLNIHILKHHKKFSCKYCNFTATSRYKLKGHIMVMHTDPTELIKYKCQHCSYTTLVKGNLEQHELRHKDPSGLTKYKCQYCNYESILHGNLKRHELLHRDISKLTKHKCQFCNYESIYKGSLKKHELIHKDPAELTKYKCQYCNFESNQKSNLRQHELIHKNPSDLTKYKCLYCDYESITKSCVTRHELRHKDPAQLAKYQCQYCNFKSIYGSSLKKHELLHKDPAEVTKYKCHNCNFESIHKDSLKQHLSVHKMKLEKC